MTGPQILYIDNNGRNSMCSMRSLWLNNSTLLRRWFPPRPDVERCRAELSRFYAESFAYRQMIGGEEKLNDPQVQLLRVLVKPGRTYLEYGSGDGLVTGMVGETADCIGYDVSELALESARHKVKNSKVQFRLVRDGRLDEPDNSVDGVFSFEVLEHVWNPLASVQEMIRVLKPGGWLMISMPNIISLDLYLSKSRIAGMADFCLAAVRWMYDRYKRRAFYNVEPDLGGEVYPDCDLVSVPVLPEFVERIEQMGSSVIFCDTTYMRAHARDSRTDLRYQRGNANSFLRCFGDHLLLLAYKGSLEYRQESEKC